MQVLNNDCLYLIFQWLPFEDQLVMTKVCQRFREVIIYYNWRNKKFHTYTTNHSDTYLIKQPQLQMFFEAILDVLENFTIWDVPHAYFPGPIALDELNFYGSFKFPRLRHVDCQRDRVGDAHLRLWARNWRSLEVLRVQSVFVTGAHINNMHNLTTLYLAKCNLSEIHLKLILSGDSLVNLTYLDISEHPNPLVVKDALELAEDGLRLHHFVISYDAMGSEFVRFMEHKMRDLQVLRVIGPFKHKVHRLINRTLRVINFQWLTWAERFAPTFEELRFQNFNRRHDLQFPFDQRCFSRFKNLRTFHANYEMIFSVTKDLLQPPDMGNLNLNYMEDVLHMLEAIRYSTALEHIYISQVMHYWPDVIDMISAIIVRLQLQHTRRIPLTIHAPRWTSEIFESEEYTRQNVLILVAERVIEEDPKLVFINIRFLPQNDDTDSGVVG